MADDQAEVTQASHRTEATPPKVPGAEDSSVSAWTPGTAAEAAPDAPMPPAAPPTIPLVHDDAEISDLQTKVDELRREIDRLAGLVDAASKRLNEKAE
jgi:hypothetical protein